MSHEQEINEKRNAYTAPAECDDSFQFTSCLQPAPEKAKERKHGIGAPLIAAVLIILAGGAAFLILILHLSLAVRYDENGFSIQLVRRSISDPIVTVEEPEAPGLPELRSAVGGDRYEWNGATLRMSPVIRGAERGYADIYRTCAPSIGVLTAADGAGRVRQGAAIVMTEDGALIASTHIISEAESITVRLDGTEYAAFLIGLDYATDLAVLKIDAQDLVPAYFSAGENAGPGDSVAVIGNPVGGVVNITDGILSAVNHDFSYRGFPLEALQICMELGDIASGSALVNAAGQVIGIVNMDMASQLTESRGIGFAISMRSAKAVIDELLQNGCVAGRPASGLTVSELPASYAAYYSYPTCLYISAVQEGSSAALAGLQRGDLILAANGEPVETVNGIYAVINGLSAGDELTLTICRDRESMDVTFELMEAAHLMK